MARFGRSQAFLPRLPKPVARAATTTPLTLSATQGQTAITGVAAGNLINDGTFEASLGAWFSSGSAGFSSRTLTRDSTWAHGGSWSIHLVSTNSGAVGETASASRADIPVTVGLAYSFEAWVNVIQAGTGMQLQLIWRDSGNAQVGSTLSNTTQTGTGLKYLAFENQVAPTGAVKATINISIGSNTNGETVEFYADDVVFIQGTSMIATGVLRRIGALRSPIQAQSVILTQGYSFGKLLTATQAQIATLPKQVGRLLSSTNSLTATASRLASVTRSLTQAQTGTLSRQTQAGRLATQAQTATQTQRYIWAKLLSASQAVVSLVQVPPINLIAGTDSDFETSLGTWTTSGTAGFSAGNRTLTRDNAWAHGGSWSGHFTATNGGTTGQTVSMQRVSIPVTVGLPYSFEAWLNVIQAGTGSTLQLVWRNSSNAQVGATLINTNQTGTGLKYHVFENQVAPATATTATIGITLSSSTNGQVVECYTDDVVFIQAGSMAAMLGARRVLKGLLGTQTQSGTLTQQVRHAFSATQTQSGTLAQQVRHVFSAAQGQSVQNVMQVARTGITQVLTATQAQTATVVKQVGKFFSLTNAQSPSVSRGVATKRSSTQAQSTTATKRSNVIRSTNQEVRPQNTVANHTLGDPASAVWNPDTYWTAWIANRNLVDGQMTGTTDELIRWTSTKWSLPVDVVRAVAVQESDWIQSTISDTCIPNVVGQGSYSIIQIKNRTCDGNFDWGGYPQTVQSTAFALDFYGAMLRSTIDGAWYDGGPYLYGGKTTAQLIAERGYDYVLWGSVGFWFSGDWYDAGAVNYIGLVQGHLATRAWEAYGSSGINAVPKTLRSAGSTKAATQGSSTTLKRLAGAVRTATNGSTPTILRRIGALRSPTQAQSGTLPRQTQSVRSATQAQSAQSTVQITKTAISQVLSAVQGQTATALKQVGKLLSASDITAPTLNRSVRASRTATQTAVATLQSIKAKLFTLTASQAQNSTVTKRAQTTSSATQGSTASLPRVVQFSRAAVQATLAGAVRRTNATKSATQAQLPSVAGIKVFLKTFITSSATATTLTRKAAAARTATQDQAVSILRRVSFTRTTTQAQGPLLSRLTQKGLSSTQATTATVVSRFVRLVTFLASQGQNVSIVRRVSAIKAPPINPLAQVTRFTSASKNVSVTTVVSSLKGIVTTRVTLPVNALGQLTRLTGAIRSASASTVATMRRQAVVTFAINCIQSVNVTRLTKVTRSASEPVVATLTQRAVVHLAQTLSATASPLAFIEKLVRVTKSVDVPVSVSVFTTAAANARRAALALLRRVFGRSVSPHDEALTVTSHEDEHIVAATEINKAVTFTDADIEVYTLFDQLMSLAVRSGGATVMIDDPIIEVTEVDEDTLTLSLRSGFHALHARDDRLLLAVPD